MRNLWSTMTRKQRGINREMMEYWMVQRELILIVGDSEQYTECTLSVLEMGRIYTT